MKKVVKFGGSSLASAEQFRKVGDIIRADEDRRYVVPSAPGKRFGPKAQNLGASGIYFRRACLIFPGSQGQACPWVRKKYGRKAARRAPQFSKR